MQTSYKGLAFLEREEGVVLRAYRDVAGVWTIGAGLTAASGVVTPRPGMTINREEASALLRKALGQNYEPEVRRMLATYGEADYDQPEFDGALSFHFNTGAIARASWVRAFGTRDWDAVRKGLLKWVKGGGKVLPALQRRREREYRLMCLGDYGKAIAPARVDMKVAALALDLTDAEVFAMRKALAALGYDPGEDLWPVSRAAVTAFQGDHGLTIDGIVGKATLTTLQRRLNARTSTGTASATAAAGGAEVATKGVGELPAMPDALGWIVLGVGALWLVWLAWSYRDAIAAKINRRAPHLADWLRSL